MSSIFINIILLTIIPICFFVICKKNLFLIISIENMYLILIAIIVRLILPLELPFTQTISCDFLPKNICALLKWRVIHTPIINITIRSIIILIWMLGISIMFLRLLLSIKKINHYIFLAKLSKKNAKTEEKVLLDLTNFSSNICIIKSSVFSSSLLMGYFRPIICMPDLELSENELNHILKHELNHFYNKDLFLKLIIEILLIFYWWHPFIYLLKKMTNIIIELRNDYFTFKDYAEKQRLEYCECILHMSKQKRQKTNLFLNFAYPNNSLLKLRLYAIMNYKSNIKIIKRLIDFFVIFIILYTYLFVWAPIVNATV